MRRTLWSESFHGTLGDRDLDELEQRLGLAMHWYFDRREWLVGCKVILDDQDGATYLRVVRGREAGSLSFELVTSRNEQDQAVVQQLRRQLRRELRRLGGAAVTHAKTPRSGVGAVNRLPVTMLASIGAADAAAERIHELWSEARRVARPPMPRALGGSKSADRATLDTDDPRIGGVIHRLEKLAKDAHAAQGRVEAEIKALPTAGLNLPERAAEQLRSLRNELTALPGRLEFERTQLQVDAKRLPGTIDRRLGELRTELAALHKALTEQQAEALSVLALRGQRVVDRMLDEVELAPESSKRPAKAAAAAKKTRTKKAPAKKTAKKAAAKKAAN